MELFEYFKNKKKLQFMIIGSFDNNKIIKMINNILINDDDKLFYINTFIENNYVDLIKLNQFLSYTQQYNNKIIFFKENPLIILKNPFIIIQKFDYIHLIYNNTIDSTCLIELIITSFNLLANNGLINIDSFNINLIFVIEFFKKCYIDKYSILYENINDNIFSIIICKIKC